MGLGHEGLGLGLDIRNVNPTQAPRPHALLINQLAIVCGRSLDLELT
jgi:hypothetical protein